jgi:hypothetical protein
MAAPGAAQSNADQAEQVVLPAHALELPAFATPPMDASDVAERMTELKHWVHDYTEWKQWSDKYLNKREFGWLAVRDRRLRPDPPAWLAEDCRRVADDTGTFAEACRLLADWHDDIVTAALRQQNTTAVAQREAPTKTAWWRHVHLDGFWPMTQSRASVFGVVGVHATVDVVNRLQVFVAPGVMLMRVPTPTGEQELRPATDWGVSYRLFNFKFPGVQRQGTLHVNLVRALVFMRLGSVGGNATVNLAGFSVTLN